VTVWPAAMSSATMAGPVSPEPPVTKTCMLVSLREEVKLTEADHVPLTRATVAQVERDPF
jgi:hypothetical protein